MGQVIKWSLLNAFPLSILLFIACGSDFSDSPSESHVDDSIDTRAEDGDEQNIKREKIIQDYGIEVIASEETTVKKTPTSTTDGMAADNTSNSKSSRNRSAGNDATVKSADAQHTDEVNIYSDDNFYHVDEVSDAPHFKKSKEYDITGLKGATAAIYGFFGKDPYKRQEFEIRFYPDHQIAMTAGVDYAKEASGADAVISQKAQRWDEGLTQRRECQANVRGSHHSGRCDSAKYGDFAVAGNMIMLCQGKDSEAALKNCATLYNALQP